MESEVGAVAFGDIFFENHSAGSDFHYACFKFLSVFYEPHLIPEAAEALFEDKRVTESGFDFIQKTEVGIGQKGVRGYKSFRPREPRTRRRVDICRYSIR